MRKLVLTIVALLFSTSAQAHVSAVPFPEIGSLRDVTHNAAFAIFQTYAGPPQIFYNIVTDGGGSCNGDSHIYSARITSITSGTKILTVTTSTFVAGDAGKTIVVPGMGSAASANINYIDTVDSPTQVTLLNNSLTTLSSVSKDISVGTDDAPNFKTFNTWARANQGTNNQVVLTVPNGAVCWFASAQGISGITIINAYFAGINNLIVEGTGATFNSIGAASNGGIWLGAQGQIEVGLTDASGKTARIQSVSAGSSTVTLTAASLAAGYASRFVVGNPLQISGLDLQTGYNQNYGVPSNHHFFEWKVITNVDGGTGIITLDSPLANSYLDTWPTYYDGSAGGLDQGGPATIYALNPFWNARYEFRGLTINDNGQTYANVRHAIFRNVTWNSG